MHPAPPPDTATPTDIPRSMPRRRFGALAAACLLGWTRLLDARDGPERIDGVVLKVRDGDTLQMLTDAGARIEVRLNAIDAPEKAQRGARAQPHAERARLNLARLAVRRRVRLQRTTMDRYGRHVGLVTVATADGPVDAGGWQVQSGYAWVYERYSDEIPRSLRARYRAAQADARAARLGLWADPNPIPPWDWRQRQRPA